MCDVRVSIGLLLYNLFPTLDTFTDLAYILGEKFFNKTLFILPNFIFFHILYRMHLRPYLMVALINLGGTFHASFEKESSTKTRSTIHDHTTYVASHRRELYLHKLLCTYSLIVSLLRIIALLIFTFFWLFIGLLLFATKAFSVSTMANFWMKYWVWTRLIIIEKDCILKDE